MGCWDDTPPLAGLDFTADGGKELTDPDTVTDEDYFEACLASSDLRELGLVVISPWAGWQVYHAHGQLFRDYRAARSAADFGRLESAARLQDASLRLFEEASKVLANFPGRSAHFGAEVTT